MRLDRELCLGGRLNNKDILGIKYNGYIIYPWHLDSAITYTFNGSSCGIIITGISDYDIEDSTNSDGSTTRRIFFERTSNEPIKINFTEEDRNNLIRIDQLKGFYDFPGTFLGCRNLKYINLSEIDTSKATDMRYTFKETYLLEELDLSSWDTSNVTTMEGMFNCGPYNLTTLDLSNFDTSKVTDMSNMFSAYLALTSLNLSSFNTGNVIDMGDMFFGCYNLITLDLSNFNTSNVTNMYGIFSGCKNLTSLDIRNFDTAKVEITNYMFFECYKLQELRLDNCSNDTINKVITSSYFPTGIATDPEGNPIAVTRKIYVNPNNISDLTPPNGWVFVNKDTEEIIN